MRAILTPDDLKKGDLVEPGWYATKISSYEEVVAKGSASKPSDGSTNCIFKFKVVDGPYKGIEFQRLFNEKALGFGKNLYAALEFPVRPEGGYDLSTDLFKQAIGAMVDCYVIRGRSDKGNDFNDVKDWRKTQAH